MLIPTRDLILEWTRKDKKPASNLDAALDQIVISVEGHRLRFDMTQTIRIPAKAAPGLVGRFGEQEADAFGPNDDLATVPVQRFVERVLGSAVEGYFQATAAEYDVLDFIRGHNQVRLDLEERVRNALAEWGVEAVRATLNEFVPEETTLDELRRERATERDRKVLLEHRLQNEGLEAKAELVRIQTDRERRKNQVTELEELIRVLGRDAVALERFLNALAKMKVPEFVGGDASALLQYMPLPVAQDMINRALRRAETRETLAANYELEVGPDPASDPDPGAGADAGADPKPQRLLRSAPHPDPGDETIAADG